MIKLGCHLSVSKGYLAMGKDAVKIGANTFQFFTRNPRGSKAKAIDIDDIRTFQAFAKENQIGQLIAHAPYTINPCSADKRTREFALEVMEDDLLRMEFLPHNFYNFHPGSHVSQGVEKGIPLIIDALNQILKPDQTTLVLLETMGGKGTEIGRTFEELQQIIEGVILKEKIGVCMDTCHVYDAGYDIVHHLEDVLEEFNRVIGLDKLYAIHLNDSKHPMGSGKDRHERIGEGTIGKDAICRIINHPKLSHLPFCLETPNELEGYATEINMLKQAYQF